MFLPYSKRILLSLLLNDNLNIKSSFLKKHTFNPFVKQMLSLKEEINPIIFNCILTISLIGLLLINIRVDQDWGDDNAQYVHQSINIVKGIPQYETGYIYNERFPILGPANYTIGFPLLLSPIYAFFGNNILAFNLYLSAIASLLIITFIFWAKKNIASWKAFLLILFLVYNPWFLRFKSEINSEIPFTLILFWILLEFDKKKNNNSISFKLVVIIGLLISIRPIGAIIPISIFIYMLIRFLIKNNCTKSQFLFTGIFTTTLSLLFFLLLNYFVFRSGSDIQIEHQYRSQLFKADFTMAFQHLKNYYEILVYFIQTNTNLEYSILGSIGAKLFIFFLFLGIIIKIRKSLELSEVICFSYIIVLLFYNYSNAGFRFLLPIAPILFLYAGIGFNQLSRFIPYKKILVLFFIGSTILLYKPDWNDISYNEKVIQFGPMSSDAQQMFEYINSSVSKNENILFIKPRALSLYAKRNSFANNPNETQYVLKSQIIQNRIHYLLRCEGIPNIPLDTFINSNANLVVLEKEFGNLRLYKII